MENKIINIQDTIRKTEKLIQQDEIEEKQDKVLNMIYAEDIDAEQIIKNFDMSYDDLDKIVQDLLDAGYIKYISNNEVELTQQGVLYIKNQKDQF